MNGVDQIAILAKVFFGGSVFVVLYVIYYQWKSARIDAEKYKIEMGEEENENLVDDMSDTAVVDSLNSELGSNNPPSNNPPKKSS